MTPFTKNNNEKRHETTTRPTAKARGHNKRNTTMNKNLVNELFAAYENVDAEVEAIRAETEARIAEATARQSTLVSKILAETGSNKMLRGGKSLTIVERHNADGTTKFYFRGLGAPKPAKNVVDLG
jgi:hypothetical protein